MSAETVYEQMSSPDVGVELLALALIRQCLARRSSSERKRIMAWIADYFAEEEQ